MICDEAMNLERRTVAGTLARTRDNKAHIAPTTCKAAANAQCKTLVTEAMHEGLLDIYDRPCGVAGMLVSCSYSNADQRQHSTNSLNQS